MNVWLRLNLRSTVPSLDVGGSVDAVVVVSVVVAVAVVLVVAAVEAAEEEEAVQIPMGYQLLWHCNMHVI